MARYFWTAVLWLTVCCATAEAQLGLGGGGLIVFDPTNFTKNTLTAAQLLLQVGNSNKEVAMMIQNLLATGGAYYPMDRYAALLHEVLQTGAAGARITYDDDTEREMLRHYPGYVTTDDWNTTYDWLTQTHLNTQRGALNTVHEELRPEDDARVQAIEDALATKTEQAQGNLDVSQAGNYLAILQVDEARRQRHMLGALTNALIVAQSHQVNLQAQAERAAYLAVLNSQIPVRRYTGVGGARIIGPVE
jgi:conjugal transfer/entry exclusion protein